MNSSNESNNEILKEFGGLSPNSLLEILNQSQDQDQNQNAEDDENDPKILKSSNYTDLDSIDAFVKKK